MNNDGYINITPELAVKLKTLQTDADKQEAALAQKLNQYYLSNKELRNKFIQATGWSDKMGSNDNVKIIKQYYYYLTSGSGDFLIEAILNDTIDKLKEENKEPIYKIAQDIGLQEVLRQFKTNTILKQFAITEDDINSYGSYAGGNKVEADTFANIMKNIMKKNLGDGIEIKDTSPHEFQKSILYDIEMSVDDFPFNMEVKAGIKKNYLDSSFKFGTFSSTSLGGGAERGKHLHDDTYVTLLPLIGQVAKDLLKAIYNGEVTNAVVTKYAIDSALVYLEWRIRNGDFPVFVNEKDINTCSEIIEGILQGRAYIDYSSYQLKFGKTKEAITKYETSPLIDFMNGDIRAIQKEALAQALKENRITPQFKSTVWYGKQ